MTVSDLLLSWETVRETVQLRHVAAAAGGNRVRDAPKVPHANRRPEPARGARSCPTPAARHALQPRAFSPAGAHAAGPRAMASGYGVQQPIARCYPIFQAHACAHAHTHSVHARALLQAHRTRLSPPPLPLQEFSDCMSTESDRTKCNELGEDFRECLHHKKEVRKRSTRLIPSASRHCAPPMRVHRPSPMPAPSPRPPPTGPPRRPAPVCRGFG